MLCSLRNIHRTTRPLPVDCVCLATASCVGETFAPSVYVEQAAQRVSGLVLGIVTISSTNVGSPRTCGRLHESLVARRSVTRVNDGRPIHPSVRSLAAVVYSGLESDVQESFLTMTIRLVSKGENKPLEISNQTYTSSLVKSNGSRPTPSHNRGSLAKLV